jgi:hypothetical protein
VKNIARNTLYLIMMGMASPILAHDDAAINNTPDEQRLIQFPDTANYKTLVLDPHTHSSFSDGHVWPRIRVEEALRDGLDAIAITEHLEWQPHLNDIPHPDRNRAYQIAFDANGDNPLMIIAGSEITRETPSGHINALFISDANKLLQPIAPPEPFDPVDYYRSMHQFPAQEAVDAAVAQEAFVFWNHPWWHSDYVDNIPTIPEFYRENTANGKIQGIEIANGFNYSEQAFQIALDLNLAVIGSSDVHELIDWDYRPHEGGHRPVTLVLAENATADSLREALFAHRTLVWFNNTLLGRETEMQELLTAALTVTGANYSGKKNLLNIEIENHSDVDFQLHNQSNFTFSKNTDLVTLKQHAKTTIVLRTPTRLKAIELPFGVLNALTAPKQPATVILSTRSIDIIE